ncbi:MAG: hypothetical protein DI587_37820 [Variovorax paradoxus]|nr:MAG: hypothetical protein DI583_37820 [Variovorax paradoxus]PZP99875.1 MAG: hypothetical protein DI587_37820 [Variovorax paradoxus]
MPSHHPAILVPIYQPRLSPIEEFSLDVSVQSLAGRRIDFIGPSDLALDYYRQRYPQLGFIGMAPQCFASIADYNRLLLDPAFYERFAAQGHVLILQTDAVVLRDELDVWCASPYDYLGAPWPEGNELFVNLDRFEGSLGKRMKVHVGNGGLSLRRIDRCAALLREFPQAIQVFCQTGSSEDLFFAFMGALSGGFVLPNEIVASHFALELRPSYYLAINGGRLPMAGHAWWKYEPAFWKALLPPSPVLDTV